MRIWQRAYLYVRRKAGKSILLLLVMLLLFSFVMAGMLLHRTTDLAIRQTRQNLGGGFRIAPDMQNRDNVVITEADGQTSITYIGAPLDEALIQAVRVREGINGYNAVLSGNVLLQENLRLIDYNGIYQDDPIAAKIIGLFTVEAGQQNTDVAAPVHLLENKIFIDLASGRALMGAVGADYVDFFIGDPAQVYQIMDGIKTIGGIDWDCFVVTASVEEYEKAAGPLLSMRELADTLLAVMAAVSIVVLSLMQALFNKSRQHEMGIMLSVGISKAEVLLQRFLETVMIAMAALVLSACSVFLIWPFMQNSIYRDISSLAGPLDTVSAIAIFVATAGCGVSVLLLSTVLSSLGVMRLSPKEILSQLS